MTTRIDEISPPYIGEDKLVLTLADPSLHLLAFQPFQVNIDYSATMPEGTALPMELVLQGPKAEQHKRRLFRRARPSSVILVPENRGRHFILFRELGHNRWQGRLEVDVEGDDLQSEDRI
jgi:hypothetical protein